MKTSSTRLKVIVAGLCLLFVFTIWMVSALSNYVDKSTESQKVADAQIEGTQTSVSTTPYSTLSDDLGDEESEAPKFTTAEVVGLRAQTNSIAPQNSSYCKEGDVLEHVYNPQRLQVINDCIQVSGTVDAVKPEKDGDYHVNVRLDDPYKNLINDKNTSGENGDLVVETICSRPVTQSDAISSCNGVSNPIQIPSVGSHVYIIGAYVLDKAHGWMEIHPAWYIGAAQVSVTTLPIPTKTITVKPTPVVQQNTPTQTVSTSTTTNTNTVDSGNGATALCNDGTHSYAANHQGACSHHGGVQVFYR